MDREKTGMSKMIRAGQNLLTNSLRHLNMLRDPTKVEFSFKSEGCGKTNEQQEREFFGKRL